MFAEANGYLINTDELLAVMPVKVLKINMEEDTDATPQYRFKFKDGKEMCIKMEQEEYRKFKQNLLEANE